MKKIKEITLILLVAFTAVFFCSCAAEDRAEDDFTNVVCPWDENDAKQPIDYTWEEFEALSGEEQIAFQKSFGKEEKFEKWMNEAQTEKLRLPWEEKGEKQPSEYTWEDFEALGAGEQIAFQQSFSEDKGFDEWMQSAQSQHTSEISENKNSTAVTEDAKDEDISVVEQISAEDESQQKGKEYTWEKEGAKQPSEYTWEDFEALSGEEQIAFQRSFTEEYTFDDWLNDAENIKTECPWDKEGAKQPEEYTWEEFKALNGSEQIIFQRSFTAADGFEKWLSANRP